MWGKRNLYSTLVDCKMAQLLQKLVWRLLNELKIECP